MVTRRPDGAYLPEYLVYSYHIGRDSLMDWGAIANGVKGPIVNLKMTQQTTTPTRQKQGGGLNIKGYADQALSGPLKKFRQHLTKDYGHTILIVKDSASSYKGEAAQKAWDKLGMKCLHHPPNSPDLNPIKPIWNVLKKQVAEAPDYPKKRESL
ncbi:DDE superfamily endonuclease [Ceratobasidium sp. AG-Ba]|nr:DDE superfamily endonuclease [Ceratobasidium sp. AG-Ba]